MRIPRIFTAQPLHFGQEILLPEQAGEHVARVLRLERGHPLILFNGDGREFSAEIELIRGSRVSASVGLSAEPKRESALAVTLVQSVPRGDRMDFIVQKATELGVARIVPTMSQRSVVRLDARQSAAKAAHWRAVVVSACEQCGRNRLPSLDEPRALLDYLGEARGDAVRLVLDPDHGATFANWDLGNGVQIAIGPEGGFAPDELEALRISGFERVRLGPRILRTETAAIAALTWLQTQFGDMQPGA